MKFKFEVKALPTIILTCIGNDIVSYSRADEIVVYDMDKKDIVSRFKKPQDPLLLEELLEDLDPMILVTTEIPLEVRELMIDMGVKILIVSEQDIDTFINNTFT